MLDGYVSEKEQLEAIRKWWNENGKYIAIAVVIGLMVGLGWRYLNIFEKRRAENAGMVYASILQAEAKKDDTTVLGGTQILMNRFSGTPYAALSALLSARINVNQKKFDAALTQLQWVVKHSDEKRLQQIARINAARILLQQNEPKAALVEVSVVEDKAFLPMIDWVKGDIYAKIHNAEKARAHYRDAKAALSEFPPVVNFLNKKIAQPI